ncbi:hypothetical protein PUNSTDRAFT_126649 [Punctularia strigosozonata HHB-11173 SS5]|uniref:uncharacterized protein n=1 Tax=Punctularia strigosozonata (strain HHB-11173) TaxID=741275 RepID=UPI0004416264|nr:uncharacterized protein PUNSTDRAFT_126649 [Punctularia strigosozonata HHB-11173 SS5]EIN07669.1 hypothetical protein PUNSTDRAFT_126649 [Punctularia strigosozonata HHB-11173 SS5]
MPRRPPPTSLRLVAGPLPPRSKPRHTLPSLPMPAFYPTAETRLREKPRASRDAPVLAIDTSVPAALAFPAGASPISADDSRLRHSRSSSSISSTSSTPASPAARQTRAIRGPWDHSSSIPFQVDVDALLAAPAPAALTVGPTR